VSSTFRDDSENYDRQQLLASLEDEVHAQSALMMFFHEAIASRLGLNPTDQRCLEIVLKAGVAGPTGPVTPGQLAKVMQLTTGAITGVLDRLEQAGYVRRENDPADRRRVIVVAVPERIKRDVSPVLACMSETFQDRCASYSDTELRLLIDFMRCSQAILRDATQQVKALQQPPAQAAR
jgi:DNA-binding MarR family transcriptional regulator